MNPIVSTSMSNKSSIKFLLNSIFFKLKLEFNSISGISRKELVKRELFDKIYEKICAEWNESGIETPRKSEYSNTYFKGIGSIDTNIEQQVNPIL